MYCVLVDFAVGITFPLLVVCYICSWSIYFCVGWEICIMQNYRRSVWYLYQSVYLWYSVVSTTTLLILFSSLVMRSLPIETSIDCSIIELD